MNSEKNIFSENINTELLSPDIQVRILESERRASVYSEPPVSEQNALPKKPLENSSISAELWGEMLDRARDNLLVSTLCSELSKLSETISNTDIMVLSQIDRLEKKIIAIETSNELLERTMQTTLNSLHDTYTKEVLKVAEAIGSQAAKTSERVSEILSNLNAELVVKTKISVSQLNDSIDMVSSHVGGELKTAANDIAETVTKAKKDYAKIFVDMRISRYVMIAVAGLLFIVGILTAKNVIQTNEAQNQNTTIEKNINR